MGRACCVWIGLCLAVLVQAERVFAQVAAVLVEKEKIVEAQGRGQPWKDAAIGLELATREKIRTGEFSRAAVRFTDLSMLRLDELVEMEIAAPPGGGEKTLEMKRGGVYFFSREKEVPLKIRTAATNGALRGTEFALRVAVDGKTTLAMFEGEVELSNPQGRLLLRSGEVAEVEVGGAPRRTAMIEAHNLVQWCLYYPAVIDPAELAGMPAYAAGDVPGALDALRTAEVGAAARAAVILSSGQVEKARAALQGVSRQDPKRRALERMIAAVQGREVSGEPVTASEWLAESYARQARHDLGGAREAARRATELSPGFGFAWARLGELEFSFGRIRPAMQMAERALEIAPKHAQAHALQGFLLAAENRHGAARRCFEQAIALDPALGNAWLGRGLIAFRQGDDLSGRRDLQTAAVLEPRRSVLRSYLGKAFSQTGQAVSADIELERAAELDPADPTPPLYTAIQRQQENRYNEAIAALERSLELNDNRRVYRSQFLLDQDRAIRGANLAAIYQNAGLTAQSLREAARAVNSDYTSAPAHLFLANSFNALRDPTRILLRYEPAWFNELLLANLLAPVGGGSLSQFVSEHEYSKLFEADGPRFSSLTEYRSDGQLRATASQFGTAGNLSYALDAEYFYDNGYRPNNEVSRFESYGTFKLQLGLQDTLFFQAKFEDTSTGDLFQRYDPRGVERTVNRDGTTTKNTAALTFDFRERQDPGLLLGGWHHEWAPGHHTLLLLGRLASRVEVSAADAGFPIVVRDAFPFFSQGFIDDLAAGREVRDRAFYERLERLRTRGHALLIESVPFDTALDASFETWTVDLQHIATLGRDTLLLGGRYQRGDWQAQSLLTDYANGNDANNRRRLEQFDIRQSESLDLERINLYTYYYWRPTSWLGVTAGLAYDSLQYPENFTDTPISGEQRSTDEVSPKIGLITQPWRGAALRAVYAETLVGASFDESVRLEPVQVAGFTQSYRTAISESRLGSVAGSHFKITGLSLEQRLPTRTYLAAEYQTIEQDVDTTLGAFDRFRRAGTILGTVPSGLRKKNHYREDAFTFTIDQLLGDRWSLGASYQYTRSRLRLQTPGLSDGLAQRVRTFTTGDSNKVEIALLAEALQSNDEATLHHARFYAYYNHPSGFFARAEANWFLQDVDTERVEAVFSAPNAAGESRARLRKVHGGLAADDFWQIHLTAGWRFLDNRCEIGGGVLNLTDADYQLDPLTPYVEMPRERTFFVRCRLNF